MYAIELRDINKIYKEKQVLKNINLKIYKGDIYGFIGRNGAGKSTTLKIICELTKQSSGEVLIYGEKHINKKVGFLIEELGFLSHMSAYENLMAQSYILKKASPNKDIEHIMDLLRIEKSKKLVSKFSMGMKQRLGIGMSLLSNPEILILDEPVNALDAEGIIEIRNILKDLNKEGKTILISSHILGELEKVANRFGIIKDGVIIDEFSKEKLEKESKSMTILSLDTHLPSHLNSIFIKQSISYDTSNDILKIYNKEDINKTLSILNENNVKIISINTIKDDLESYFIRLMGGNE